MIDADFVKEIERLTKENKVQILKDGDGREFFTTKAVPNPPPQLDSRSVCTLDGLVDLVESETLECSAFITGPRSVSLAGKPDALWRQREVFAVANIADNGFPFGRKMEIEEFIINLQCNFEDSEEKKKVIDLVSSITTSEVVTADDDGIAQEVVVKAAIGHKMAKVQMDPIVSLVPYRTFREITQPADKFLLRMHPQKDALPQVSLRSAGGDLWQYEAIASIYDYLKARLPSRVAVIR